jgi:hypothetical protein
MRRLTISSLAFLCLGTPCLAADLDGPAYRERDVYIERPPVVVEKRIVEHHHYYEPAPVYSAPQIYYAPRGYTVDAYYDRPHYGYRHTYSGRPPDFYFSHGRYWRPHRHHRW